MDFKQYLDEAAKKAKAKDGGEEEQTSVVSFGRFNPPTIGHQKLIQKTEDEASVRGAKATIIASHSEGTSKNPVPQKAKLGYLGQLVKHTTEVRGSSKAEPTIMHAAAKEFKNGAKHFVMVAGSDRVKEYQDLLDKYNDGKQYAHGKYKFKSIKVVSAGQRDPDAEGVEGMSGTKIRDLARKGQTQKFKSALPLELRDNAEEIAGHIKAIKEDYDNPYQLDNITPEQKEVSVREAYIQNEIFKLNDIVEAMNGDKGPIVFRGSSYVTMQIAEGKTVKHWIKDIKESSKTSPTIIIKPARKIMEKQIPALFLPRQKLEQILNNETYNSKEVQSTEVKETITMSNLRKRIAEMHAETANRDINRTSDKEVYHGIDKTIEDQGHPGKPPGLVSFKTFAATPETQKIEQDKDQARQDAHRAKTELGIYSSSSYRMMKKYHQTE
jgi:hypothetical protein